MILHDKLLEIKCIRKIFKTPKGIAFVFVFTRKIMAPLHLHDFPKLYLHQKS